MKKVAILICMLLCLTSCGNKNEQEPTISLYKDSEDKVVDIKLEEYLQGVVAGEMATDWPIEALKAQAVLARTFTLKKIEEGGVKNRGTDASTNVEEFQAYDDSKINDNVKKAVSDTKGMVVTYDDALIKAWFFADGGGVTATSALEGLGYDKEETPYIKSVTDPGDSLSDNENKAWQVSFTLDEVKKAIESVNGNAVDNISTVKIIEKGKSGRATKLKFNDVEVSAVAFRLAIGSEKMKSTLIDNIKIENNALVISGKGYGHGVGLSQWGAKALALEDKNYEDIIKYFYKDVEIKQMYK